MSNRAAAIHSLCLGYIHRTNGETDKALACFTEAIQLHGDLTLARTERATLLDELGQADRAAQEHDRAFVLLNEIVQEGGERRRNHVAANEVARALAELVRADPRNPANRRALTCWLRDYDIKHPEK